MEQKVQQFLDDARFISSARYDLIMAIRKLFQDKASDLIEGFKYGGLIYSTKNGLVSGIFSYRQHLSIEFGKGSDFSDPKQILEGAGKHRRHIKIRELTDLEEKDVAFYIQQAIKTAV